MNTLSKNLIEKLYYKERLSTIKIAQKLDTTEWIILSFMRRNNIARRSFSEASKVLFEKKKLTFSIKRKLSLREEKLKTAGIFLYWGEGAQLQGKNCGVDFANSNPEMIKVFLSFLRRICGINEKKLRVFLYCYTNQDIEKLLKYWHNTTHIPINQFTKPYIRKDFKSNSSRMEYGLVHIRYADKKLLIQIDEWIKGYTRKFVD